MYEYMKSALAKIVAAEKLHQTLKNHDGYFTQIFQRLDALENAVDDFTQEDTKPGHRAAVTYDTGALLDEIAELKGQRNTLEKQLVAAKILFAQTILETRGES